MPKYTSAFHAGTVVCPTADAVAAAAAAALLLMMMR